jgi:hypothetical protein
MVVVLVGPVLFVTPKMVVLVEAILLDTPKMSQPVQAGAALI